MDLKRLSGRAKDLVDKRGGPESLKQDAGELRNILKGPGSFTDKAKSAAGALKRPGGDGGVGEAVQEAAPEPTRKDDAPAREARPRQGAGGGGQRRKDRPGRGGEGRGGAGRSH